MGNKVTIDTDGRVEIPPEILDRLTFAGQGEVVVEPFEGGLRLLRAAPDARKVYLEPTSRCNLNCRTCVRNSWQEPVGNMPLESYCEVLGQLRSFPEMETIHFCGFGEPLSHPHIFDMLRLAGEQGLKTELTTNGVLLDRVAAGQLLDCRLHTLVVSVDGAQPETYGDIRGADLARVTENVRALTALKRERGTTWPRVGLEFVAMKRNFGELTKLVELAVALEVTFILVTNLLPYTEEMQNEILYADGGVKWPLSLWWFGSWDASRIILPQVRIRTERYCRFVERGSLSVAWDGRVSPCYPLTRSYPCYVLGRRKEVRRYTLGNALDQGLVSIWTSPDYVRFRARVRRFDFPSCGDCPANDACDFVQTNEMDCWGNSPSCADCLWARGLILCF